MSCCCHATQNISLFHPQIKRCGITMRQLERQVIVEICLVGRLKIMCHCMRLF